jgi:hypothetical protein
MKCAWASFVKASTPGLRHSVELVEKYRRYAEEARAKARAATDPNTKRDWLEIANAWSELSSARLAAIGAKNQSDVGKSSE